MPQNERKKKEYLLILGPPIGELCRKEMLDKKNNKIEKISDVIDNLDAHYGFYFLKNCFSMPKLLYFLRTSPCFFAKRFFGTLRQATKKFFMQGH